MNPFKKMFCHHEVKILPVIEETLRDYHSYSELGIFNRIEYSCILCGMSGVITIPAILTTKTPGSLVKAIAANLISDQVLGTSQVKVVI